MAICKICNNEYENFNLLTTHIRLAHKISVKDYYDTYIKTENEGICKTCSKPTKFISITAGYRQFCCGTCTQKSEETRNKIKLTNLKRCGKEYYSQTEEYAQRIVKTSLEKYGVDSPNKDPNKIKHATETCLNKYGVTTYSQTDECKKRVAETNTERHGAPYLMQVPQFKEQSVKTCLETYHVENVSQCPEIQLKKITTNQERHGCDWYNNKEKAEKTSLLRHGTKHPMQNPNILAKTFGKYIYDMKTFDSSWEIAYYIWLKDNKIDFKYHPNISFKYKYNGKIHYYCPDFLVNNILTEIKGPQFIKNERMINPYDSNMNDLFNAKYKCMLENNVNIITDCKKYLNYVNEKYGKSYIKNFKIQNLKNIFDNLNEFPYITYNNLQQDNLYNIIQHFHKSIWHANLYGKLSPIEAWQNEKLMLKVICNRIQYKGLNLTADMIRDGLSITRIAPKVSVFKPSLAIDLINTYLNDYDIIVDPFSGFSGRMLGAYSCGKHYYGKDINEEHVTESNKIIDFLHINDLCHINVENVITAGLHNFSNQNTALFTCPPYKNKECWNKSDKTCNKSCDDWIDLCIEKYKCKNYLFVVDETEKYKNNIVKTIENKSHFGTNYEYVILI